MEQIPPELFIPFNVQSEKKKKLANAEGMIR